MECPTATTIRISTMTATSYIGTCINLTDLYNNGELDETIKCIQFRYHPVKGVYKKNKKKSTKKCFYNQVTFILELDNSKKINLKIFLNGKIQMTGLRNKSDGIFCIQYMIKYINNISECLDTPDSLKEYPLNIVLINSDFDIKFKIKRDILYELLVNDYNMFVSYEPDIYPGVNIKFFWNKEHKYGVCDCIDTCNGKGLGEGDGDCKKVTISTFQSGKVIITGARSLEQIKDTYDFITNVFKTHYERLKRIPPPILLD